MRLSIPPQSVIVAVGVLFWMVHVSAHAATLGDPKAGEAYARGHCQSCHSVVRDGNTSAINAATPLQVIANTGGITRTALYVFFRTSHPRMPNLIVKGDDLDNIIAYILSLKTTK